MTFDDFRKEFKLTEDEAHELVHHLASIRMAATLGLTSKIPPDRSAAQIIEEHWKS